MRLSTQSIAAPIAENTTMPIALSPSYVSSPPPRQLTPRYRVPVELTFPVALTDEQGAVVKPRLIIVWLARPPLPEKVDWRMRSLIAIAAFAQSRPLMYLGGNHHNHFAS